MLGKHGNQIYQKLECCFFSCAACLIQKHRNEFGKRLKETANKTRKIAENYFLQGPEVNFRAMESLGFVVIWTFQ